MLQAFAEGENAKGFGPAIGDEAAALVLDGDFGRLAVAGQNEGEGIFITVVVEDVQCGSFRSGGRRGVADD